MNKRRPARQVGVGLLAASTVLSLALSAPAASAQTDEPRADSEEIVVTARRREEGLLDTPVAVTALPAEELESRGITDIAEVANSVPNTSFSGGSGDSGIGNSIIFVRGIGQADYANSTDPGVGTYIDGVYLGRTIGGILELADIAQVEVLRGPQGTLFGKNTMGGAINISLRRPSFENEGSVAVTVGDDNRLNLDFIGDLRLSDAAAVHVALGSRNQDGFVERLNGGDALGEEDSVMGRIALELRPSSQWNILLSADYSDIGGTSPRVTRNIDPTATLASLWNNVPFGPPGTLTFAQQAGQPVSNDFSTDDFRSTNATGSFDTSWEGGGVAARIEYDISPNITLRSISAYREFEAFSDADQDGQSIYWGFVRYEDEQEQFSQEFNLFGTTGPLDWIVGVYYFDESAAADQFIDIAFPLVQLSNEFSTDVTSYAAFAEGTWAFNDVVSASIGARYTRDEKTFLAHTYCRDPAIDILGICDANGDLLPETISEGSWESVDPRIGLQIRPREDLLFYATYSTGFKSGGFNARASTPGGTNPYDPETVDSIELGLRGAFDDGRLQVTAAVFHYDYEDLQFTATGTNDTTGIGDAITGNAGSAEIQGAEFELLVRPVEYFTVNAALGYTDARYTEIDPDLLDLIANDPNNTPVVTLDNELQRTPELTFSVGAELVTAFASGEISWRADFSFIDKQFSDVQNFELTASPAHTNLNARIAYTPDSERFTLALYGRNLTDEAYNVNGFYPDGGGGAQILNVASEPREVGVQLRVNFGG